jgi:hypothetical protein
VSELDDEVSRLALDLRKMLWKGDYAGEAPMAIHERATDSGHGLGGPAFHPRFLSYLRDAGVCMCEPEWPDGTPRPHACDRRFAGSAKFREPRRETHPRRLKRAFRQLRLLAPFDQYHIVFLVIARGRPFPDALAQVNEARLARGDEALTQQDGAVMLVAGTDLLAASW